jgi:hypothetical protein
MISSGNAAIAATGWPVRMANWLAILLVTTVPSGVVAAGEEAPAADGVLPDPGDVAPVAAEVALADGAVAPAAGTAAPADGAVARAGGEPDIPRTAAGFIVRGWPPLAPSPLTVPFRTAPEPGPLRWQSSDPTWSLARHAFAWQRDAPLELTRFDRTLRGIGAGARAGLFVGAMGDAAGLWEEETAWYLVGAATAIGAMLGATRDGEAPPPVSIQVERE